MTETDEVSEQFLSSCHARARAPRWMKMVSSLPASRVESLQQGWRQGRPNVGAVSLMSSWTRIPAGTTDCGHLPAGRRARTVESFYRGIPPALLLWEGCHGRDVHALCGVGCAQ